MKVRDALRVSLLALLILGGGCAESHDEELFVELAYPPTVEGGYEHVSEFLPDEEAAEILASFAWEDTAPLPETSESGLPTIYYVVMRLDSHESYDLLDAARLPWSYEPLFASERRALPDDPLTFSGGGSHGAWVFALISGEAYNYLRDAALMGAPIYGVVALRDTPPEVVELDDGSLDLRSLAEAGIRWPDAPPSSEAGLDEDAAASVAALTEVFTELGEGLVAIGTAVADVLTEIWGWFVGSVSTTRAVTFELTIASPDADFVPFASTPLLRTWGPGRGAPIANPGQEFIARDVDLLATYRGTLDTSNEVTITLPVGARYRFCVRNRYAGARVVNFFAVTETCSAVVTLATGATTVGLTLADQDLQDVTLAADGTAFMAFQQMPIRPPIIASGNQAQLLATFNGNGFVLGLGGRDPVSALAHSLLDTVFITAASTGGYAGTPVLAFFGLPGGPVPLEVALFIRAMMNVDIVWPPGNPSRLVFAHEFGHHIFYQLMNRGSTVNPAAFGAHLLTIFLGTITGGSSGPGPGDLFFEPLVINEAVADVFGAQLGGGGNRLSALVGGAYPGDGVGTPPTAGVGEVYCDPSVTPGCFENNLIGTEGDWPTIPLNDEVGRLSTLMYDMHDDFVGAAQNEGYVWPRVACTLPLGCPLATAVVPPFGHTEGTTEETVALPLISLAAGITFWLLDPVESLIFRTDSLMHGMTRSMRASLVGDAAICRVYSLHTPLGVCPVAWMLP